jgi:hypothetical protein
MTQDLTDAEMDKLRNFDADIATKVAAIMAAKKTLEARWVAVAVAGALADTHNFRRSILTGRCAP